MQGLDSLAFMELRQKLEVCWLSALNGSPKLHRLASLYFGPRPELCLIINTIWSGCWKESRPAGILALTSKNVVLSFAWVSTNVLCYCAEIPVKAHNGDDIESCAKYLNTQIRAQIFLFCCLRKGRHVDDLPEPYVQEAFGTELTSLIEDSEIATIRKLANEIQGTKANFPITADTAAPSNSNTASHTSVWIGRSPVSIKLRLFCLPYAGGVSENVFARSVTLLSLCPILRKTFFSKSGRPQESEPCKLMFLVQSRWQCFRMKKSDHLCRSSMICQTHNIKRHCQCHVFIVYTDFPISLASENKIKPYNGSC